MNLTSITIVTVNNYYFLSTMIFEHLKIAKVLSYAVLWDGEILLSPAYNWQIEVTWNIKERDLG